MGGADACPVRLVRVTAYVRVWVIVRVRVLVSVRVVIRLRVILGVDTAGGTRRNSRHLGKPATLTLEPAPGQSTRRARPDGLGAAAPARRAIRAAGAAERPVLMRHRGHRSAALPAVAGEYRARRVAVTPRRVEVTFELLSAVVERRTPLHPRIRYTVSGAGGRSGSPPPAPHCTQMLHHPASATLAPHPPDPDRSIDLQYSRHQQGS